MRHTFNTQHIILYENSPFNPGAVYSLVGSWTQMYKKPFVYNHGHPHIINKEGSESLFPWEKKNREIDIQTEDGKTQ